MEELDTNLQLQPTADLHSGDSDVPLCVCSSAQQTPDSCADVLLQERPPRPAPSHQPDVRMDHLHPLGCSFTNTGSVKSHLLLPKPGQNQSFMVPEGASASS